MKIGFIGCGNMGEAFLAGSLKKFQCVVCELRKDRRTELTKKYKVSFGTLSKVIDACSIIFIVVKPQEYPAVLKQILNCSLDGKLFVSIAAGVRTDSLEKNLGVVRVVRVMPNLPALAGFGVSALCRGKYATDADLKLVKGICDAIGTSLIVKEQMMDAVTAVSGSGPAYVFLFAESLVMAAKKIGFSNQEARQLVYATLSGSSRMLVDSDVSAEELRMRVTSKGGTTQAAIDVFMKKDISGLILKAVMAAQKRAIELSG